MLFLVFPLGAVALAVSNIRTLMARNIIWLYCGFFGFTFVISSEGIDAAVYRTWFENAHRSETISFMGIVNNPVITDYFVHVTNYIVSRFTGDYRVLFMIFGLIYGYFYATNIHFVVKQMPNKFRWPTLMFLILFVFIVPFWNINGIRFYLATHMFFFGVSRYVFSNKVKDLIPLLFAPLVHFSFLMIIGLFLAYLIVSRSRWVILVLAGASLTLGSIGFADIVPYIPQLDGPIGDKVNGYTYEEFVLNNKDAVENASWFLFFRQDIINYVILIFSMYWIFFRDQLLKTHKVHHFIYFGIFMIAFSIFLNVIPSMGRMMYIGHLFLAAGFCIFLNRIQNNYWSSRMIPFYTVAILLFVIVEIRIGLDFIGIGSFINNPLIMAFFDYKHSFGKYF